ncbi:RNA pseudouridine synthase [Hydrogenophaga sp. BPS33]|uniref:RNA pseudouridine synthase n=1 Tax=Hydrogenophaga sp. BPS33 TaxID=2651974 RepID=UPI00131FCA21|nr:RNA pseudouridine synthase [Hydrogenophaga sp. BPS33]QHE87737.1 RNA-binding protein [Hydrogenophaga sp. BPS33]
MNEPGRPEPQRLAKRLAAQLPCSRSDAENYIAGGWVRVDGVVVEEPMVRVRDEQTVLLDPKARLEPLASMTLIWHKPANRVLPDEPLLPDALAGKWFASAHRFEGDRSGVRPLKAHLHKLQPLAPLGHKSSGLMAFSQNPAVARKLTEDAGLIEHEWLADVADDPALRDAARREAVVQSLGKALFFDGWSLPSARASWQSELRLRLAIKGNQPGQVAHLCERAGLQLTALRRQRLGRISLSGLPVGQWRYLSANERF